MSTLDFDLAGLNPSQVEPSPGVSAEDPIARKIRAWWLEWMRHKLWKDYLRESDEDEGYYTAAELGAWSVNGQTTDARDLATQGRPVVSLRHIKPQVDVLVGTQRQNRVDPKALPQGDEDEEDAQVMTQLLRHEAEQRKLSHFESAAFKAGLIRGMSAIEVGVDWSGDPVQGRVYFEVLKPGKNVVWDPWWSQHEEYDLDEARGAIRWRWAWCEDVIAQHPKKEQAIRDALARLNAMASASTANRTTDGGADAYGGVTTHPIESALGGDWESFYDPAMGRVMVATAWFRAYEPHYFVHDKTLGQQEEYDTKEQAQALVDSDPDNLTLITRQQRIIRTATVLPATGHELEGETDSPYENDREHYPIIPFIADKTGDVIEGLVRGLKDPQRIENKRISQAIELAQKYASMRRVAEENSVINPDVLNNPSDQSTVWVRPNKTIGWDIPKGLADAVHVLEALAGDMKVAMREIGPSTDLLGQKGEASSGIAIARRQIQSQTTMFPYFDNFTLFREHVYARLARRIQQTYTLERTIRLRGPMGEPMTVLINPTAYRGKDYDKDALRLAREQARLDPRKPRILRDVEALDYDVVFAEAPATPTARAALVEQLSNVVSAYPAFFPVVAHVLIQLLPDLPDRPELLAATKRWQASIGLGEQPPMPPGGEMPAPPGTGPGGMPIGATPNEVGTTVMQQPPGAVPAVPVGALQR